MNSVANKKKHRNFSEFDDSPDFVQDRMDLLDTIKDIVEIEVDKQVNARQNNKEESLPYNSVKISLLKRIEAAFARIVNRLRKNK